MTSTNNTPAQITSRLTTATLVSMAALAASGMGASAGTTKTVDETRHWTITQGIEDGAVTQCAARRKQRGPNKLLVVRRDIGWLVQFYNPAWKNQELRKTTARLTLQGRKVAIAGKFAVGTSFIFHIGKTDQSADPVARAKWLTFVTERGNKIGYTVRGIADAMERVAACYDAVSNNSQPPVSKAPPQSTPSTSDGGAFGTPPKAEAEPKTQAQPAATAEPKLLDKQATLPFAKAYLKSTAGYKFLPDNKGPGGWRAKWELKSGVIGALVVLVNDPTKISDLLTERLKRESAACKGQFETNTSLKSSVSDDPNASARAVYVCKHNGKQQVGSYSIRKASPTETVMILELYNTDLPKPQGPKLVGV